MGGFQFAVLSTLRAAQLMRGCTPKVDGNGHKRTVIAQTEVAEGKVQQFFAVTADASRMAAPSVAVLEHALEVVDAV